MKKGLVVLLIAVLALGAVFADVSKFEGKLTSELTWDLDEKTLVFKQTPEIEGVFNFGLFDGASAKGAAQGEVYPYAVIEGALAIKIDDYVFDFTNGQTIYKVDKLWDGYLNEIPATGWIEIKPNGKYEKADYEDIDVATQKVTVWDSTDELFKVKAAWKEVKTNTLNASWSPSKLSDIITTAKIVGEKWELDLLKNFGVGNFATNALADSQKFYASAVAYKTGLFDMDNSTKDGNGVTFTYDGYKVAVNQFTFDFEDRSNNDFQLSFQTKDFEYEGVTGTFAFNFQSVEDVNSGNISAKAGYTVSDVVLAAAADVRIATEAEDSEFDVAFGANYKEDAVKFDFYYASLATAKSPYTKASEVNKDVLTLDIYKKTYLLMYKDKDDEYGSLNYDVIDDFEEIEKLMSLKGFVDVAKLADLGPVSALSVQVDGHDILNKDEDYNKYAWNAEANAALEEYGTTAKFGVKKFTVKAEDGRTFYAEATTDFAKFAELPVNTLTLTVGSNDLDMDANVQDDTDCLYATVASDINDDLSVSVKGNYLAGKERTDKITVAATYKGIEKLTLGASVAHEFAGDVNATEIEATAKYEHDLFTADAKIQTKLYKDSDSDTFRLYVGATSDKIVHGATLSLAYGSLDDDGNVENNWVAKWYGAVVAKCVIAF